MEQQATLEVTPEVQPTPEAISAPVEDKNTPIEGQPVESTEVEPVESEFEEVEFNGNKYAVPKELAAELKDREKSRFLEADYTRKTQTVAEQRKALAARMQEIEQAEQVHETAVQHRAQLVAFDSQISQYENVNWAAWAAQDPVQAQQAFMHMTSLKDQRAKAADAFENSKREALGKLETVKAQQLQEDHAVLAKEIAGWSTQLKQELANLSQELGLRYTRSLEDPGVIRALNEARMFRALQKQAKSVSAAPAAVPAKSITSVKSDKDPSKMSDEEWIKHREAELRQKRKRL